MVLLYIWMAAQIILEMLPISSSTHLRLIELWFTRKFSWNIADYFKQRNIDLSDVYHFLHLPTLLVVLYFFGSNCCRWPHPELFARMVIWVFIVNAITAVFYYLFKKYSIAWPLFFGMCITALVLLLTGTCTGIESNATDWNFTTAIYFGIVQGIALLPGISRLAFTTAAGCCIGIPLLNSFYISWFMYVPLMIAAIGKSTINLYHKGTLAQLLNWRTCLVMLVSGIISWYVFTRVLFLILINKWWLFGWYMLIPIGLWVLFTHKKR